MDFSIKCDSCKIKIGPEYLTQNFFDVGPQKICKPCYDILQREGKIYLGVNRNRKVFMLQDGSLNYIDIKYSPYQDPIKS